MINEITRALGSMALDAGRRAPVVGGLVSGVVGRGDALSLDGKVVFITGAARGLGAEIARQAHERGACVALVGRRLPGLQELADDLGERAAALEADVTDLPALQRAAAGAAERFGGIDVVVANAGIAPPSDSVLTIDPAEFERTVDVDLLGQWRTVRAVLPYLIERRGHVVVVSSIYAFFNGVLNASYAASKAGIEQLTRALRVELAYHGASAGVAYLGFIGTDLTTEAFARDEVAQARQVMPAFATKPISVQAGASGHQRHRIPLSAHLRPYGVLPMLHLRGIVTTVMDEALVRHAGMSRVVRSAEESRLRG